MAQGISLHIGVKKLDTTVYESNGCLASPENDASTMMGLAQKQGFKSNLLLTELATKEIFLSFIEQAASVLNSGDILLVSFAGHGGQLKQQSVDLNNPGDEEDDGYDEFWCFYDNILKDDEIGTKWCLFKEGVRIVVISASCHSQTALKWLDFNQSIFSNRGYLFYYPNDTNIKASIMHLSSCSDEQESYDGSKLSKFTSLLIKHWDNGNFNGTYEDLIRKIGKDSGYNQQPSVGILGVHDTNFLTQKPFTI